MPHASSTHKTLIRHLEMLRIIPRLPQKVTARQLSEKLDEAGFPVSERTVQRDLKELMRHLPLVPDSMENKPVGWSWMKYARPMDVPHLTNSETIAFRLLAQQPWTLPPSVRAALAPILQLAESKPRFASAASLHWPDKVRNVAANQPLLPPPEDEAVVAEVSEALLNEHQLDIHYRSRGTPHEGDPKHAVVHPLGLVQRGTVLYLVCTFFHYQEPRIIALHRVVRAKMLNENIRSDPAWNLDDYLASGAFGWSTGAEDIPLHLRFYASAGDHLLETPLAADQQSISQDDALEITATVPVTEQLCWWLLSFGPRVEVLGPPALRERMGHQLATASAQYAL